MCREQDEIAELAYDAAYEDALDMGKHEDDAHDHAMSAKESAYDDYQEES